MTSLITTTSTQPHPRCKPNAVPFSLSVCQGHFESQPWFDDPYLSGRKLVARFFLPLELCPTANALGEMERWKKGKLKKEALNFMLLQYMKNRNLWPLNKPLPGKPLIRAIRFSSRAPDPESGWSKIVIDRLLPDKGRMGLIEDDSEDKLTREMHWHRAKPGVGYCVFELLTDTQ